MRDIVALFQCIRPSLTATTVRQLSRISMALLAMSGRVTMLGLSRWAGHGGSSRTVQRFFATGMPWATVFWLFFRHHLFQADDVYLLGGDECVVTKAGKTTYGLDRLFSSLCGKPVPGVSFFTLSLISTHQRRSYPTMVEQMVRTEAEKAAARAKAPQKAHQRPPDTPPKKPGRPKGSKNRAKMPGLLTPELQRIQRMIHKQLDLIGIVIPINHIVLDGHFGHHAALQMVRGCGLHLISKLRHDAALYFPYEGPYTRRGPRRKYGDRLVYTNIPQRSLKQSTVEDHIQTDIYQAQMLHKEFAHPLNVVIIVKTNLKTRKRAHVVLFSSDLALETTQLIDDYSLRFQIEFNFRDAKQYWGLEDFMNVQQTAVTNAANLSLFMVNVAHVLLQPFRQANPQVGILDLKAHFRGHKYVVEMLKLLPQKPEPYFIARILAHIATLGSVHGAPPCLSTV
jgi:putative transposase